MKKINKRAVLLIASSHTLNDIFGSFFAPLLPLLSSKIGFNYTTAGFLTVLQRIPSLLNPVLGYVADKSAIKWFLIISPVATAFCMSLIGLTSSVATLGILLFLAGFSGAVFHVTAPVLMKNVSGDRISTGMSFFMVGGELARTLGPLLVMGTVSIWGLHGIWELFFVGLTGAFLIYILIGRIETLSNSKKNEKNKESLKVAIKKMKPLFLIITPMLLFRAFAKTALSTFLPSYLVDNGMTPVNAGYMFSIMEGAATAGVLSAGILSDKIGRKFVLLLIMILTPFLLFVFTFTTGLTSVVLIIIMGFFFFASTPVFMAFVHDMNSSYPALANGLFMMMNFAASSIVSIVIGFWGDKYGLSTTFRLTALLSICSIPFALMMKGADNKK